MRLSVSPRTGFTLAPPETIKHYVHLHHHRTLPAVAASSGAPAEDESGRLCPESGKVEKAGTPCAETSLGGAFVRGSADRGRLARLAAAPLAALPGHAALRLRLGVHGALDLHGLAD